MKSTGLNTQQHFDYFTRLTVEMKLANFDYMTVMQEYSSRVEKMRLQYLKLLGEGTLHDSLRNLGAEVVDEFDYAFTGYRKEELHPEDILLVNASVYLREFLKKYESRIDVKSKNTIGQLIQIADKVKNLDL